MEIGSFLELQFPKGREYYAQTTDIARLNTGRAAIWHAFRLTGCRAFWLPVYQCDTVRDFLNGQGVPLKYYHLDRDFNPVDLRPADDEAVLFVNYYGIMSPTRLVALAATVRHAVIDNCQGFFSRPLAGCQNVYSCRKFVGVPDGAYVIGDHAEQFTAEYPQGYSSDTALFLLQRIEYGCEGKAYKSRGLNEHRIDTEPCLAMSRLTRTILDGTDYEFIRARRRENFAFMHERLGAVNRLDPLRYYDDETVPMVYPLVIEDDALLGRLQAAKHFQGHWWSYLCDEVPADTFEYWISRYVIPMTIDQRYDREQLAGLVKTVLENA